MPISHEKPICFKRIVLVEGLLDETKMDRDNRKRKEAFRFPTFYKKETGWESYSLASMGLFFFFKEHWFKGGTKTLKGRGKSLRIILRQQDWTLIQKLATCDQLNFRIAMDQWLLHAPIPPPPFKMGVFIAVIWSLYTLCIEWGCRWSRNLSF